MSQKQISLSVDLQKLQDQGYDVEIRSGHVIINSIPYVNSKGEIALGALVSPLDLAGEVTKAPQDHKAWFIGDHPCTKNGIPIEGIKHSSQDQKLADDIEVN